MRWGDKRRKPRQKDKGRRRVPTAPISKSTNTAVKRVCSVYFPLMHIVFPEPSSGGVTEVPPRSHTLGGEGGLKTKRQRSTKSSDCAHLKINVSAPPPGGREGGMVGRALRGQAVRACGVRSASRRRSRGGIRGAGARARARRHSAYHLSILSDLILIFLICVS